MILLATIGAKALYLLFVWLISASVGSWLSARKGYGERVGLAFGMILSAVGLLFVLLLPGRPGSAWKEEGPLPRRGRGRGAGGRRGSEAAGQPSSLAQGPPAVEAPSEREDPSAGGPEGDA